MLPPLGVIFVIFSILPKNEREKKMQTEISCIVCFKENGEYWKEM
jgi:hypothetical protein